MPPLGAEAAGKSHGQLIEKEHAVHRPARGLSSPARSRSSSPAADGSDGDILISFPPGQRSSALTMEDLFENVNKYKLSSLILTAKQWLGELSVPVELDGFSVSVPAPRVRTQPLLARLRGVVSRERRPTRTVLHRITTHFDPGRMCLVIGGPQSGQSTLLQAIADRLPHECTQDGEVRINGQPRTELSHGFVRQVLGYVPSTDEHVPVLTVEETLRYLYFTCVGLGPF